MDPVEFDRLFDERLDKAAKLVSEEDALDVQGDIALDLHADILETRTIRQRQLSQPSKFEELDLAASQQAFFCYSVLQASERYERMFNLMRGTLKHRQINLDPATKQRTVDLATESFSRLCKVDDFQREAKRILVGLGLPSTWDEFTDYDGNRCRIQIDLNVAKLVPEDLFESLATRFYYTLSSTDDKT